jgi:sister-chromatid-cohesion protein PDS5
MLMFSQHLSEIQLAHGRNPDTNDMEVLTKSHQLALKFSKYCPELLNNYMPMLEESLRAADEIFLRQLTTKTLGSMFGQITKAGTSPHDTIRKMPNTWKAWLGRRVDRALQVRLAWVESTYDILANVPEVRKELESQLECLDRDCQLTNRPETLRERLTDSNEQIRAAICTVLGKLHYETVLHHIDLETLQALSARMGDKKVSELTELSWPRLTSVTACCESRGSCCAGKMVDCCVH